MHETNRIPGIVALCLYIVDVRVMNTEVITEVTLTHPHELWFVCVCLRMFSADFNESLPQRDGYHIQGTCRDS